MRILTIAAIALALYCAAGLLVLVFFGWLLAVGTGGRRRPGPPD